MILPVMLLIYLGSVEASALISMDRRVQSISGAVGDLVARSNTAITAATLTDYFQAAQGIMAPHSADPVTQVVTAVSVAADGQSAKVLWSRQYVDRKYAVGVQYRANQSFTLPDALLDLAKNNTVIVSEASFSYLPLRGLVFHATVPLHRVTYYLPRFEGGIQIR
ncbi:hypothetical protein WH87_11400 [Devosia epidermidihirudinis]|uniref:Uncharacterized protein n=2 Tax=Devosia epidermidihirudinis TaxID=1293439 RepID=A0A0F5QBU4_9HYPH|nr:hypothetical protein WH87_11400 [Devosia epidermidihirudinis]